MSSREKMLLSLKILFKPITRLEDFIIATFAVKISMLEKKFHEYWSTVDTHSAQNV